jgi:tripeptide aminopeptidase
MSEVPMVDIVVSTFLSLLAIDSPSGKEDAIRQFVVAQLAKENIPFIQDAFGNVYAWVNCSEKPPISFSCHLDTVDLAVGVKPLFEDGLVKTDHTTALGADDKLGVAMALTLMQKRHELGPFGLLFTVQEEVGLQGAKHLGPEILSQLACVFVLDTGKPVGTMIIRAPWKLAVTIAFHGKAAHAGIAPEEGLSAISLASKAINSMQLLRIDDQTTANIGSLHAQGSTNVVCDYAELHMEIRSLEKQRAFAHLEHVRSCCNLACSETGGTFDVSETLSYAGYQVDVSKARQLLRKACNQSGLVCTEISTGGGSDANILREQGIDAVLLGIGYEGGHGVHEQVGLEEIKKLAILVHHLAEVGACSRNQ